MFKPLSYQSLWVYMNAARLYSARELTHPRDILAAFSGIASFLTCSMGAPFVFGLPASHFDLALLWQHNESVQCRTTTHHDADLDLSGRQFSSWSWMEWIGSTTTYENELIQECLDDPRDWLATHTWVRWYIRYENGDLRPLWTEKGWRANKNKDMRWRGYSSVRISGALMSTHYSKQRLGYPHAYVSANDQFCFEQHL
jgi:hypothetical protein